MKINIDFKHVKKIEPFINHNYAIKRENCEIVTLPNLCNIKYTLPGSKYWKAEVGEKQVTTQRKMLVMKEEEPFKSASMKRIKRFFSVIFI